MIKKTILLISLSISLSTLSNNASAELYTWKDEQGTTHITDDISTAPLDIQKKYEPKTIDTQQVITEKKNKDKKILQTGKSAFNLYEEGWNKNGKYYMTTMIEKAAKEPQKYKYMWSSGEITFYTSRKMEDWELSILPKNFRPNGKFIRIFLK